MTMIINCSLCGVRFYADTKHECAKSDPRVIELLEKILECLSKPVTPDPAPADDLPVSNLTNLLMRDRNLQAYRADEAEKALDAESLTRICQKERAEDAEAKRDEWKARYEALREDVETRWAFVDDNFLKDILHSILKGDDERAKGEQR